MAEINDLLQDFKDDESYWAKQFEEMRSDLRFSNPACPEQWDENVRRARESSVDGARPCLTFDQTNQYIAQVVNDSRQNKPAIKVMPSERGDIAVANTLEGVVRHIEYQSRASICYDTAQEHAARIGLGWMRVLPVVVNPKLNQQEIRIQRVHDPLSVMLDPDSTEPDGSDATRGWVTSVLSKKAFQQRYPGAAVSSWNGQTSGGWFQNDALRIAERFTVVTKKSNCLIVDDPEAGRIELSEDEYWRLAQSTGVQPTVVGSYEAEKRSVRWLTMSGTEVLEETDFPSKWIPLIPVLGYELWVDGKRYLCGMVRRMRDAQQAYNYERSAYVESVALQPKAPWIVAAEAVEGYEDVWAQANTSNKSYLPWNAYGEDGETQLPQPMRNSPPPIPASFIQGGQMALSDIQASIGMYRANLGAPSNETSGKAINARKIEGDTANFHYIDNLSRSMEHLGRIVVDMIPAIYDTRRVARIMGVDGSADSVVIDPDMPEATQKDQNGKVTAINPNVGDYDVRVKVGPSFTTLRQESGEAMAQLLQRAPDLIPVLGPEWIRNQDWPNAEKVAKLLLAMAPQQVQAVENDKSDIPPEVMAKMQGMQQELEQCQQLLQKLGEEYNKLEGDRTADALKAQIDAYNAETNRLKVTMPAADPQQVAVLAAQIIMQSLNQPDPLDQGGPPPQPSAATPEQPNPPTEAGFFTPEQGAQDDLPPEQFQQ